MNAQIDVDGDAPITPQEPTARTRLALTQKKAGVRAATALLKAADALSVFRRALLAAGRDVQRDHSTPRLIDDMREFGDYLGRVYGDPP